MNPKILLPYKLETASLFRPAIKRDAITIKSYIESCEAYAPDHPSRIYREETKVVLVSNIFQPNLWLGGLHSMMFRLMNNGNVPLSKLHKSFLFAAFPHSAKKILSTFESPAGVLSWIHDFPEEVFEACEFKLEPMPKAVRKSRAIAAGLTSIEIDAFTNDGTLPKWAEPKKPEKINAELPPAQLTPA